MHGRVASRGPAGSPAQKAAVGNATNHEVPCPCDLDLQMTFQAKVVVALSEHFPVDAPMRFMTNRATFAQCFVLENKWSRLLLMTLSAGLVFASHCQAARRFHDVVPVRVVALHAIHPALKHPMVARQPKLSMYFDMTIQACRSIAPWIDDELAYPSSRLDVQATRAVAGLTTGDPGKPQVVTA